MALICPKVTWWIPFNQHSVQKVIKYGIWYILLDRLFLTVDKGVQTSTCFWWNINANDCEGPVIGSPNMQNAWTVYTLFFSTDGSLFVCVIAHVIDSHDASYDLRLKRVPIQEAVVSIASGDETALAITSTAVWYALVSRSTGYMNSSLMTDKCRERMLSCFKNKENDL